MGRQTERCGLYMYQYKYKGSSTYIRYIDREGLNKFPQNSEIMQLQTQEFGWIMEWALLLLLLLYLRLILMWQLGKSNSPEIRLSPHDLHPISHSNSYPYPVPVIRPQAKIGERENDTGKEVVGKVAFEACRFPACIHMYMYIDMYVHTTCGRRRERVKGKERESLPISSSASGLHCYTSDLVLLSSLPSLLWLWPTQPHFIYSAKI